MLDVLVQKRRDTKAAKRLMRKLLKKYAMAPRVMITDKLRSYAAAKRDLTVGAEHRQHKGLNNRAENSHQPTRRRERIMKRFKSRRQAQSSPYPPTIKLPTSSTSHTQSTHNSECGAPARASLWHVERHFQG